MLLPRPSKRRPNPEGCSGAGQATTVHSLSVMFLLRVCACIGMGFLLGACATGAVSPYRFPPLQNQPVVNIPDFDFHGVSPEMESFLEQHVMHADGEGEYARNLVLAATDRNVFPFDYDPNLTLNSVETFRQRAGNCLAFSSMFVAMARHLGLGARYQEVEIPPEWSSLNNTVLVNLHVNVVLEGRDEEWVIDVSGRKGETWRKIRRIKDAEAIAQYYNNLGAEALTKGEMALAYAYFVKSIETQPRLSYVWSNLGVLFGRNGQPEEARRIYEAALAMDPQQLIAASNLYLLYEKEGNVEAAANLQARVERYRRKNPYYLYHLSLLARQEGRYAESTEMLNQAIDLHPGEYRFHYDLARNAMLLGLVEQAKWSLEIAQTLAPDNPLLRSADIHHLPELPE